MSKLETIRKDLLVARKSKDKDKVLINLLTTLVGEIELSLKGEKPKDVETTVEELAKKFTKNAKVVNGENEKREITYLSQFLPQVASMEAVKEFLKDKDLTLGGRLIGMAKQHFGGKVDPQTVNIAINELK